MPFLSLLLPALSRTDRGEGESPPLLELEAVEVDAGPVPTFRAWWRAWWADHPEPLEAHDGAEAMPAGWAIERNTATDAACGLVRAPQTPHDAARSFLAHLRAHGMLGEHRAYKTNSPRAHCGIYGAFLEFCEIERRAPVPATALLGALQALPGVTRRVIESKSADGKRWRPVVLNIGAASERALRKRRAA